MKENVGNCCSISEHTMIREVCNINNVSWDLTLISIDLQNPFSVGETGN